jgi:ribose 1,5-bisphosphokinase
MTARYAIYYAPEPESAWGRFGLEWLGRCAESVVAAPRRYGFHATLKAPFRLARGARLDELVAALERLCETQSAFRLPGLRLAKLDDFLALVPASAEARLSALAAACVRGLDQFRAPLNAAELARRRKSPLSPRERMLLARWGYPYVLDRFRFHLSLTASLRGMAPEAIAALRQAAESALAPLAHEPLVVDSVCVFEEPAAGADFRLVHRAHFPWRGRLVYVMGPSGAGKDSLLDWARARLPEDSCVRIAQRTITRAQTAGGERHCPATEAQFDELLARGAFALHWRANGVRYGVPSKILEWLDQGLTVVVNGSREHLPAARARFPRLEAVHVAASAESLSARLAKRGREDAAALRARQARNTSLAQRFHGAALHLRNDGPIERCGAQLLRFLQPARAAS